MANIQRWQDTYSAAVYSAVAKIQLWQDTYMQVTTFPERPAHPRTGRSTREREWADSRADQNSTINVCRRFGYLRTKKKIISLGTRKNLHTYSPCTYLLKQSYPTFPVNKSFLSTEDKHKLYSKQSPFTCMRLITLSGFK